MAATVIGDLFVRLGVDATQLTTGLTAAEKRLDRFGTQMFFLGTRITAGISIPVGLAMAKIAEFGGGFDKAMTESLAIMQNVSEEMRTEMERVAQAVSTSTKFSSKEAAEGYYSLASAGLDAAASMGALPIAAKFAQAGVFDLAKSTEFLAGAQASMASGFTTSAQKVEQMANIADVLTLANNRALGTIQDFAEALTNKAGAALRQTNKSVEEGVAVLAAYAEQNIKGKYAGQQLWMVIRDLGTYALKNSAAFKKFGIGVFDASGSMRNMADIIADVEKATDKMSDAQRASMFVQLGIPLRSVAATKALIGYSDEIRNHEAALRQAGGTTDEVSNKQMASFENRMKALAHQFQNSAIALFKSLIPAIENFFIPAIKKAAEVVNDFVKAFDKLPTPVKAFALGLAGIAVAIGPVVAGIGSMTLLTSAAVRGFQVMATSMGAASTAIGLTVGTSSMLTKYLTMMSPAAAAAAAAAYDAAKAQGIMGAHLNRAATAAANAAGWQGRITNATVAASVAQAQANGTFLTGVGVMGKFGLAAAAVGAVVLSVNAYTKDWGETLKWFTIPGFGLATIISDLNAKLIEHGGVLGDLARIARGTFSIIMDGGKAAFAVFAEYAKAYMQIVANAFDSMVDGIVKAMLTMAKAISYMPGGETASIMIVGLTALLPKLRREIKDTADAMDRLAGFGTYKGPMDFQKDLLTGGFKPWQMPKPEQNRFAKETGPAFDPRAFGMPDDPEKLTAAQKAAKNLADQWRENSKQVQAFRDAWASLTAVERADTQVLGHAWEAYDKLRQSQGVLIPQFEKLFEKQIEQQEITKAVTFGLNEWGVVWSDAAIKMEDSVGQMYLALTNLRDKASLDAFWKKNATAVEEIMPFYNQLDPLLRVIVDRYQAWALATARASGALQDHQTQVSRNIGDYLAETAAKLTDAQSELTLFSKSYLDKELVGLKKGMAQQELARKQSYNKQLASLSAFADNPVMFAYEMARLKIADENNKKISQAEYRLGLYRIAQSVGVNKKIIEDFDRMSDEVIEDIIRQKVAWNDLYNTMSKMAEATSAVGSAFSAMGLDSLGTMLSGVGAGLSTFMKGADTVANADTLGETITGLAGMIEGAIKSFQALQDVGSRALRAVGGALAGAQMGAIIGGPIGAGIGAIVGGIAGAFMADPDWKMVQKTVKYKWNMSVTKELANQIDKDAEVLGGHVNAMLMHLNDIANEQGGMSAANVGQWAFRLKEVFPLLERGMMGSAQAAKTLDASFESLTAAGTTTNGFIGDQIRELIQLERRYETGSAAIRDFVDAQLELISSGFNDVVSGSFGSILPEGSFDVSKSLKKQKTLIEQIGEVGEVVAEISKKEIKTEADKLALMAARFQMAQLEANLRREQSRSQAAGRLMSDMAGPKGQESFDRMGRLALVTFDAMIGSGRTFIETLDAIGPSLDLLSAAQDTFGFASSEAFQQLLKFRDFSVANPELVAELSGLQNMMRGLTNLGFITQESFSDLGAEATSVFERMVAQGLTSDEALQMMQPTLQMLWQLEEKFGYTADEATQALIDQAEANGMVGEAFMSANDRMILGIDRLIDRFDAFLTHLGIKIPNAANDAATAINDAGANVDPWTVDVNYRDSGYPGPRDGEPEPVPFAEGGILRKPILAGEAGPEAIIPLDRLFDELRTQQKADESSGYMPVSVQIDGDTIIKTFVRVAKRNGWAN